MATFKRNRSNFNPAKLANDVPQAAKKLAQQIPSVQMPSVQIPSVQMPSVQLPKRPRLPSVEIPSVQIPPRPRIGLVSRFKPRPFKRFRAVLRPQAATDALLRAQLARTSRQLAQESTDIGQAVGSLKATIKVERRKARVARRRRLAGNLALGAAVMYHLDPDHGRERRRTTARRLTWLAAGLRRLSRGLRRLGGGLKGQAQG